MKQHIPEEVKCCRCKKMVDNIEENYYLEGPMCQSCKDADWTCPECGHCAAFPLEWCDCGLAEPMKRNLLKQAEIMKGNGYATN